MVAEVRAVQEGRGAGAPGVADTPRLLVVTAPVKQLELALAPRLERQLPSSFSFDITITLHRKRKPKPKPKPKLTLPVAPNPLRIELV